MTSLESDDRIIASSGLVRLIRCDGCDTGDTEKTINTGTGPEKSGRRTTQVQGPN